MTDQHIILYPYGLCNLRCSYCFIDKNKGLTEIDNLLKQSFEQENYYIDFISKHYKPEEVKIIEFWGGEPTLGFDRLDKTLTQILEKYYLIDEIQFSSNFTTSSFIKDIESLFNIFKKFPTRNFLIDIQMSYDGPGELTNKCRGKNVAERVKENYVSLVLFLKENYENYKNLKFRIHNKPTISIDSLRLLGKSDEHILDYWRDMQFFTSFMRENGAKNTFYDCCFLTMAAPSPWTQEDGIFFKHFCERSKYLYDLYKEDFQDVSHFVPYFRFQDIYDHSNDLSYLYRQYGICGIGLKQAGFMPNNVISSCHSTYVDLVENYQKEISKDIKDFSIIVDSFFSGQKNIMTYPEEQHKDFKQILQNFADDNIVQVYTIAAEINQLAKVGLVERKYENEELAFRAAAILMIILPVCFRDRYNAVGCIGGMNTGELKLYLNGALEIIIDEQL